jgi:Reverse transcriptase (RNA-dependent DNA polymerase)
VDALILSNRQQRVKIRNVFSDWISLKGGMPQGTWLGPYVILILILINDLNTIMASFKFVDDVTLTEIINQSDISSMQLAANQVAEWPHLNFMNINTKKTKEMLLGPVLKNPPPPIVFGTGTVDRVASFKLLGVTITNNLSWEEHVSLISTKAGKRIHFLKLLKRSSMTSDDLILYYKSVIRLVLEYACPVWQSGLV